jgi:hypothetical protein
MMCRYGSSLLLERSHAVAIMSAGTPSVTDVSSIIFEHIHMMPVYCKCT